MEIPFEEATGMKFYGKLMIGAGVAFALLQLARPGIPAKSATAKLDAPPQVRNVLEQSCYSCHSDERRLAWFDQIVPGYWLVRHDILTAREGLNFSTLASEPPAEQKGALYEVVNMIQLGAMPLPRFLSLHPEAKVTPEELTTLKAYLAPWSSPPEPRTTTAIPGVAQPAVSLAGVQPEFNGFPFDPVFKNWMPISFTDSGSNSTFRFVLANGIAVKAAQSGHIAPWPDGSLFAKLVWQQETGSDGLIHPGKFLQVQMMLKDAQRYKSTDGWGWGQWNGDDLKPFGKDARFVNECTGCHMPMRGNDYVYTLPMTTAHVPGEEIVNNQAAALPAGLPYQPLDWHAITMYVDRNAHTMSALYGNDVAMQSVNAHRDASGALAYMPGSVLALVTWVQRDDPHWFGARIPAVPQSVEFVQVATASGQMNHYQRFAEGSVAETHLMAAEEANRTHFILNLAPAQLP
jgi:mono/diheme cytochrome c family protein